MRIGGALGFDCRRDLTAMALWPPPGCITVIAQRWRTVPPNCLFWVFSSDDAPRRHVKHAMTAMRALIESARRILVPVP
jgi:hypothetical protein